MSGSVGTRSCDAPGYPAKGIQRSHPLPACCTGTVAVVRAGMHVCDKAEVKASVIVDFLKQRYGRGRSASQVRHRVSAVPRPVLECYVETVYQVHERRLGRAPQTEAAAGF